MKITFLGATGTVTGSKYLVEHGHNKVLIDCGLFQGLKELRLRNWDPLPIDPSSVTAVILTHAHIDHSGYLPLLVKNGFYGPVYCTDATGDLCRILLPDSGYLQEEDAARANRYGYTKHNPAKPLYTREDAFDALDLFRTVAFDTIHVLEEGLTFKITHAGHILGAGCVTLFDGKKTVVFSGDLGRPDDVVTLPPSPIHHADYLVLESTYGDRVHEKDDPLTQLESIITKTVAGGGTVVIPAFAVGRAQSLMYFIHELKKSGRIPNIPVYLDSPMAINVSELLWKHHEEHKLTLQQCKEICESVIYTNTVEDSKSIYNRNNGMPSVIISASGMATGGRVLHHLKHFIGEPKNAIILAGFQAAGTRGARLLAGEKEIKIHGFLYPVRAQIIELNNFSAHADYIEMLQWLKHFKNPPRKTFLTHGELASAEAFKQHIEAKLRWNVSIPAYKQTVILD